MVRRLSILTAPVIYSLLLPLAILDVWVTLYQLICFPVYGIARVPRRRYFAIDRHKLAYLNAIEKVNCTFCSYANGYGDAARYRRELDIMRHALQRTSSRNAGGHESSHHRR